jgi:two-component system, LytTR family, response regulator
MIKAVLVDDEVRGLRILEHMIAKFKNIEVVAACTDAEEAIAKIDMLQPQLVLLDINMPNYNGFEVLEMCSYKKFKSIFVTAYNEYAIKAFKYSAVDYLLKPVEESDFDDSIQRALAQIDNNDLTQHIQTLMYNISSIKNPMAMKVCISNVNGFSIVDCQDILYCEADSCYTLFKLSNGNQIVSAKTLSEFELVLDPSHFIRIHRSYIININHISDYFKGNGGHVVMKNGAELEVSRRKKDEFIMRVKHSFKE